MRLRHKMENLRNYAHHQLELRKYIDVESTMKNNVTIQIQSSENYPAHCIHQHTPRVGWSAIVLSLVVAGLLVLAITSVLLVGRWLIQPLDVLTAATRRFATEPGFRVRPIRPAPRATTIEASTCSSRTPSVTAAPAATAARGAARTLAPLVHVVHIRGGHGIPVEQHDRVGEAVPLIGFDPRLDGAAGRGRREQYQHDRTSEAHPRSLDNARIWSMYSFS